MDSEQNIPPNTAPQSTVAVTFWKTDGCALLFIIVFWPVGLFLMWKYSSWKKWVKVLVTILYTPTIAFLSLIFGLYVLSSGWLAVEDIINPVVINQASGYTCTQNDTEWGKCTNIKKSISFEYPLSWNYVTLSEGGDMEFSPNKDDLKNTNGIVNVGIFDWENEAMAQDFMAKFGDQQITVNGISGTTKVQKGKYNIYDFATCLVSGKTTYTFEILLTHPDVGIHEADLQTVFQHMVNSFKIEQ